MAIDLGADPVALRSQLDPRHIGQPHRRAVRLGLDHDAGKFLGRRQSRLGGDSGIEHLSGRAGRRAHLAGGDLGILRGDRAHHVARHQRIARQPQRIEPDAHRELRAEHLGLADAVDPPDRVLQVGHQPVGHLGAAGAVGSVEDADHQQLVGVGLGDRDALLLHLLR